MDNKEISLALRASATDRNTSLKEAGSWTLVGEGYESAEAALAAGRRFVDVFLVALTRARVGADFGGRAGNSVITDAGLKHFAADLDVRLLRDVHGLMEYEVGPPTQFLSVTMNAVVERNEERFIEQFTSTLKNMPAIADEDRLAHQLFHASTFERHADVRFLLLVMAIEALIAPEKKSKEAIDLVTAFEASIGASGLSADEKNSLRGSAKYLRDESINQAGKRLAVTLVPGKSYRGLPPDKFFSEIYAMRSRLVHGALPVPIFSEISELVADLETFVSDVLGARLPKASAG